MQRNKIPDNVHTLLERYSPRNQDQSSLERDEGSKRTKERPGIESCRSREWKRREGQNTKLKTKGRAILPFLLPTRNPTQDIVLAA